MSPRTAPRRHARLLAPLAASLAATLAGCWAEPDVVIYCALDQVHAEPLIQRFEEETGLTVRAEFDVEANKTVGLVNRLRAEKDAPRCDVFWNNEVANTVALAAEGMLQPYESPEAADIPAGFKDADGLWTGFAARARVLIVNTDLVDPAELHGMFDVLDPRWSGKVALARPLTGTTLTHMAALYEVLGEDAARTHLRAIKAANDAGDVALESGNAQVMRMVSEGELAWGWTDTDDFNVALDKGKPVARVVPDQGVGEVGVLLIPNSVAILAGAPHVDAAKRLVDFIVSRDTEAALAASRSAQIPVRPDVPRPDNVLATEGLRLMPVDFGVVGRALPARHEELKVLFLD